MVDGDVTERSHVKRQSHPEVVQSRPCFATMLWMYHMLLQGMCNVEEENGNNFRGQDTTFWYSISFINT